MKITILELKQIIRKSLITERSFPRISVFYQDGKNYIIDDLYGQVLAKDIDNWNYKDYFNFLKDKDVFQVNVFSGKDDAYAPLKSGEYSKRKFLDKLSLNFNQATRDLIV